MNTNAIASPCDKLGFCHRYGFDPMTVKEGGNTFSPASYHALQHIFQEVNAVACCYSMGLDLAGARSKVAEALAGMTFYGVPEAVTAPSDLTLPSVSQDLVEKLLDNKLDLTTTIGELAQLFNSYTYGPDEASKDATLKAGEEKAKALGKLAEDMMKEAEKLSKALPSTSLNSVKAAEMEKVPEQEWEEDPDDFDYDGIFRINFHPEDPDYGFTVEDFPWDLEETAFPQVVVMLYIAHATQELKAYLSNTRTTQASIIAPLLPTVKVKDNSQYGDSFPMDN